MRSLAAAVALLLFMPLVEAQVPPASGPHPAGDAHFATDGPRRLAEADLASPSPRPLNARLDHAITVTLAPSPLLDHSRVRLLYAVEGGDPLKGRQASMPFDGTTPAGDLRFTAILHPADLAGPAGDGESLVRFVVKYRLVTDQADTGPQGRGYSYVRDATPPTIDPPRLNGQATAALRPTEPLRVSARIADSNITQATAEILGPSAVALAHPLEPDADGYAWRLPSGAGLPDGTYDVRVQADDAVGNHAERTAAQALRIDATPPHIQQVLLNGRARLEAGPSGPVEVAAWIPDADTAAVQADLVDQDGLARRHTELQRHNQSTWTAQLPQGVGLPDGTYLLRITAQDAAGNAAQAASPGALVVDAMPPAIYPSRILYALGAKQAARGGDLITVQVGVQDANTLRSVFVPSPAGPIAMTALGGPFYEHSFPAPTGDGDVFLPVAATDAAGNLASAGVRVAVDNRPPAIADATASPGPVPRGATLRLTVVATDQGTDVRRVVADATSINAVAGAVDLLHEPGSTTWQALIPVLASAGEHPIPIVAFDEADNQATHLLRVVVQDGGPAIGQVLLNGRETLYVRPEAPVTLQVEAAGAAAVEATIIGAGEGPRVVPLARSGATAFSAALPALAEGRHRIAIHAVDADGQSVDLQDTVGRLVVDGTAPRILSFVLDAGAGHNGTRATARFGEELALNATVQDASPVNVTVTDATAGGELQSLALQASGGGYRAHWRPLGTGTHTLHLVAQDAVGLSTEATLLLDVLPTGEASPNITPPAAGPEPGRPGPGSPDGPPVQGPAPSGPAPQAPPADPSLPVLHGNETLAWGAKGGSARCVQVQASINQGPYHDVEPCTTATTLGLVTVGGQPGDSVSVRARLLYSNQTAGPWKELTRYRIAAAAANATRSPLHLQVPQGGSVRATARVYDQSGRLVAQEPMNASDGAFRADLRLPPGTYRVQYELQDSSGASRTVNQSASTQSAETHPAPKASQGLLLFALVAVPAVGGGIYLLLRRRRGPKKKPAAKRVMRKEARPHMAPEPPPPVPEAAEERGVEQAVAAAATRVLAPRDRASVGPGGEVRLFGGGAQ